MKSSCISLLTILLISTVFISGCVSEETPTKPLTTTQPSEHQQATTPEIPFSDIDVDRDLRFLKTLAEQYGIRIGGNYDYALRSETHDKIFEQEYNAMTVGIFWGDGSRPSRTEYDFSEMDIKVNWGLARGMDVLGQTLVWFSPSELPDWFKAAPKSEVEKIMNEHIDTVVGRYKGKVKFWNVVNEAVDDGDTGTLRQGHKWAEAMGDDYIRKAFIRANAADPTAVLYYLNFP